MTGGNENRETEEQDILHEVNAHVHEAALRFEGTAPGQDWWEFTCECGAPDCRVAVSLTLAEYEAMRAAGRPVLAVGHKKAAAGG